jgi:hypothetical protein
MAAGAAGFVWLAFVDPGLEGKAGMSAPSN